MDIDVYKLKVGPGKVLLQIEYRDQMTEGGIILPESVKIGTYTALVLAVGNDITDISSGDVIVYDSDAYGPQFMRHYAVFRRENILARIEEEDEQIV